MRKFVLKVIIVLETVHTGELLEDVDFFVELLLMYDGVDEMR